MTIPNGRVNGGVNGGCDPFFYLEWSYTPAPIDIPVIFPHSIGNKLLVSNLDPSITACADRGVKVKGGRLGVYLGAGVTVILRCLFRLIGSD